MWWVDILYVNVVNIEVVEWFSCLVKEWMRERGEILRWVVGIF